MYKKKNLINNIFSFLKNILGIKATLIYPATEQHIIKYRRQEFFLVYETAEDYRNLTTNFIKEGKFSLSVNFYLTL